MPQLSPTHYDVLEVPANAPAPRIKEAYRVMVSIWHPDRFPRGTQQYQLATRKLKEINAAYEILRNVRLRNEYDRRLVRERRVSGIYWTMRASGHYGPPTGFPNLPALLTYVGGFISGGIFLFLPKFRRDRFVRFNAWQSTFFSLAAYLVVEIGSLLGLDRPVYWIIWMTMVVMYALVLMKNAYYNQPYLIPVIGEIAARRAGLAIGPSGEMGPVQ